MVEGARKSAPENLEELAMFRWKSKVLADWHPGVAMKKGAGWGVGSLGKNRTSEWKMPDQS